ncbi:MAG: N-acetylmuramoyl-L-alanine amidase [Defluviitaleaceae bacterium]|nr:N-acetylmuramoyl-L-alanine amidase [Defluviitaleaceae bacterium]
MSGNRQAPRGRGRQRRRLSNKFYGLLAILVIGAVLYFVVTGVIGGEDDAAIEDGYENGAAGVIAGEALRVYHDHVNLVYRIVHGNSQIRISNPMGFAVETAFDPAAGQIILHTDIPIILDIQGDTVHLQSPRDVYERVLVIDAGHGGYDIGAPAPGGVRESDIVLAMAHYLYALFEQSNSGITVFMTRHGDDFMTPRSRADFANAVGHMKISIHTNAFSDTSVAGTETLYSPILNANNPALAQIIQNALVAELGTRDRGIFTRNDLYQLANTRIPAAMAEIDFKTNPAALENLTNSQYQQRVARALYEALILAFNAIPN